MADTESALMDTNPQVTAARCKSDLEIGGSPYTCDIDFSDGSTALTSVIYDKDRDDEPTIVPK